MVLGLAASALALAGCGPTDEPPEGDAVTTIQEVKDAHTEAWMALPDVVGVGIGLCDGEECIRIYLARPSTETEQAIPERIDGYLVDLEITGDIRPRTPPEASS